MTSRMRPSRPSRARHPLATIAAYGPDTTRATKLVVSILRNGQTYPSEMRSWSTDAGDVRNDRVIAAEVADWLPPRAYREMS